MSAAPKLIPPVFPTPVRWTLRVLSWAAFLVSGYLAWHSVNQSSVAGCGIGTETGCDMVLSSSWSKWFGIPVAVPGLACYAALAGLSVLLGLKDARIARWINTLFVMLAALAAVASVWFLAVQVFAIGHYCRFCIITDICGIAIGLLAVGFTIRWMRDTQYLRRARVTSSGMMALRAAVPGVPGAARPTATSHASPPSLPTPSLPLALGGASFVALLLIGGQILFPAKGYEVQQVALQDTFNMDGPSAEQMPVEPQPFEPDNRVAMRIPNDLPADDAARDETAHDADVIAAKYEETEEANSAADDAAVESEDSPLEETGAASPPDRERLVKFLGGKLTLDTYKHPLLGSPEAPHVVIEMVSYNCKHCRQTHRTMKQALARYGDQVAVIVMIIPFERDCNKLITGSAGSNPGACSTARMAVGVAALRPTAFPRFHDWLMADKEKPPATDSIVARAYGLVDREKLRQLSGSEQLKKQIEQYVDLFATLRAQHEGDKEFGLPIQIVGDHVISGSVDKPSDLYKAWEEHLGVEPQ